MVISSSNTAIDTIDEADAIINSDLVMDWTSNTTSYSLPGLSTNTTYFFAVLVKDAAGNMSLYTPASVTTSATVDTTAPTTGTSISFSATSSTSTIVCWGAATDNITAQASLQYKVVKASSGISIDTISEADAITSSDLVMDWTVNTTSKSITGLTASTTYFFAVLVKDTVGNMSLYAPASITTHSGGAISYGPEISSWVTNATKFTTGRSDHTSVINNGYVYILGGTGKEVWSLDDVQFAPINSDGSLGAWMTTTPLLTPRYGHTSVVYNGYIYVIGGNKSDSKIVNEVQYAHINSDGTVGTWNTTNPMTYTTTCHTSVVYNGYLYVIGGRGSGNGNDVLFAKINSDGTIGGWYTATSFTSPRYAHSSVVNNGYLYVIGGQGYLGPYNGVQFAPINSDGSLGAWNYTTSFPSGIDGQTSVVNNNYIYVIAGGDSASIIKTVQYAMINSDGTIGAWNNTTSLVYSRSSHTSVLNNGYIYSIGGIGYLNDIEVGALMVH